MKNTEKKNLETEKVKNISPEGSSIQNDSKSKPDVINVQKEAKNNEDESNRITVSIDNNDQWIYFFNSLKLSPFARNYFGYLQFESFNNSSLVLVSSSKDNKIPENVHKEFKSACEDYFKKNISIKSYR